MIDMTILPAAIIRLHRAWVTVPGNLLHACERGPSESIDLPLEALAWEDASGRVWLSYNDPGWLAQRHGLDASSAAATGAMPSVRTGTLKPKGSRREPEALST